MGLEEGGIVGDPSGGYTPPPRRDEDEDKPKAINVPGTFDEENPFDWRTKFRTDAVGAVEKWAEEFGVSKFALDAYIRDNMQSALNYININVMAPNALTASRRADGTQDINKLKPWTPSTPGEWDQVWRAGIASFSMQLGFDLLSPPSKAGSGSRGPRKPTAQEIRNQFDMDQLTDATNNIWQGWLVEDAPEARKLAKAYVDEIVRTRGEQEIDFATFIQNRIKKTSRYGLIYQNKPDGISEQQYLQPYVQSAQQIMGGGQGARSSVADIATAGAALGASGEGFRNRLTRTDAVQNSQGFITGLEDRVRGVSDLLRG